MKWKRMVFVLALFTLGFAPFVFGQYVEKFLAGAQAGGSIADDTSVALLIKGTAPGSDMTVTVAADGNLTFQLDSAAYTGFECPVSGALGGIIDVSDTACDTMGEVVDIINADTNDYIKAVILDGLRTDSSNDTMLAASAADIGDGETIYWDTNVALHHSYALTAKRAYDDYILGTDLARLVENPFDGVRTVFHWGSFTSTYGSGTSTIRVYTIDVVNLDGGSSETASLIYEVAGGATTVAEVEDLMPYGLPGDAHEKVLVRLINSAAMASTNFVVNGIEFAYP